MRGVQSLWSCTGRGGASGARRCASSSHRMCGSIETAGPTNCHAAYPESSDIPLAFFRGRVNFACRDVPDSANARSWHARCHASSKPLCESLFGRHGPEIGIAPTSGGESPQEGRLCKVASALLSYPTALVESKNMSAQARVGSLVNQVGCQNSRVVLRDQVVSDENLARERSIAGVSSAHYSKG